MPTARRRHLITETDEVAAALDEAAQRWPEERSRARLIVRLLHEGHHVVSQERAVRSSSQTDAVHRTAGAMTGVYRDSYLRRLREDWPD